MKKISIVFLMMVLCPFYLKAHHPSHLFSQVLITNQILQPTSIDFANDGRVFISTKDGKIIILEDDEAVAQPFFQVNVDEFGERGLHCVRLDPDFDQNGFVYVFYTERSQERNLLVRLKANGNLAIPGSDTVLFEISPLNSPHHNGGAIRFGKDGKLYLALGDNIEGHQTQRLDSYLGKILRFNKDGSIPTDNPFYNTATDGYRAIYAMGFRNPFTMDIHQETGKIFVNDVGETSWEEINEVLPGKNYGWPDVEGFISNQTPPANYQDPVFAYDHSKGCAIVGAAFYQYDLPNAPEGYENIYLFSDYCNNKIVAYDFVTNEIVDTLVNDVSIATNLGISPSGEIYYLSFDTGIWKLTYNAGGVPLIAQQPVDAVNTVGEDAKFEINAQGSGSLHYQWYENEVAITGATENELTLTGVTIDYNGREYYCRVSNDKGIVYSDTVLLTVTTNQRPELQWVLPETSTTYGGGDTLIFKAVVTDPEDGTIPLDNISWKIDFHHDEHAHPAMPITTGIDSGAFIVSTIGELDYNVWYRIHLKAEDSEGHIQTSYVDVHPRLVYVGVKSNKSGVLISTDGILTADTSFLTVAGMTRTFSLKQYMHDKDSLYMFDSWSTGETSLLYSFQAPEIDTVIEAHFTGIKKWYYGYGNGLNADYFDNYELSGEPALQRVDKSVDFKFEWGSPDVDVIDSDTYGARWNGYLVPPITATYTFRFTFNDAIKFYLDGALLVDRWDAINHHEDSVQITLEGGKAYPLKMYYRENGLTAYVNLLWETDYFDKEVVPQRQLFTAKPKGLTPSDIPLTKAYPSPTTGDIIIEKYDDTEELLVYAYDLTGEAFLLYDGQMINDKLKLSIAHISKGLVFLKIIRGEETEVIKVIHR